MVLGIFQKHIHIVAVVFLKKKTSMKSNRQLHHLFGHPEIFLENKKLQDSGLEIDVISASGPWEETEKMATFPPNSSDSSMDQSNQNGSFLVRYFIHGKIHPKSHPKHIQIIPNSHGPFFSSRIPMFRTSQIKKVISTNFRATDLIKQVEWM